MNRTITQEETDHLFKVCENHDVSQYDLQIELVDHLASLIEQHWEEKPEDPFKYALYKALQKFGPSGFQQIKEQKQKELVRKYHRTLWSYLLEFYRWPKMLLTLALSFGTLLLLQNISEIHWLFVFYAALICTGAVIYDVRHKAKNRIETRNGTSFMLLNQLKQVQSSAMILCNLPTVSYLIFTMLRSFDISLPNNNLVLFPIALLITSSLIVLFGYFFYIPQKIKEHFIQQFPEFAK
ncbi:hypothetical protein [uncultured Draconibacterium sp.]|uniref:hypothetical protein n=1 Tax=uncultured Draconibacterium sp. TaxID=1573823 RepID=UPI0026256EEA|nr:hypothetical protein [uncultured Draconibacterium sp.]